MTTPARAIKSRRTSACKTSGLAHVTNGGTEGGQAGGTSGGSGGGIFGEGGVLGASTWAKLWSSWRRRAPRSGGMIYYYPHRLRLLGEEEVSELSKNLSQNIKSFHSQKNSDTAETNQHSHPVAPQTPHTAAPPHGHIRRYVSFAWTEVVNISR